MAMQTINAGVFLPEMPNYGVAAIGTTVVSGAGAYFAGVFRVAKSGNISQVVFRTGTVTTPQTLRISLVTVDAATGIPTSSNYGGSTPGTQAAPAATTTYTVSLGTPAAATANDIFAIKIGWDGTAGNLQICGAGIDRSSAGFPYNVSNGSKAVGTPFMTVVYDDGSYAPIFNAPAIITVQQNLSTSTTPDEVANLYNLPFPVRVYGFWAQIDLIANADVILYSSDGNTTLQSVSLDKDISGSSNELLFLDRFPSTQLLTRNTNYYLAIKPSTTTAVQIDYLTTFSAAAMNSFSLGSACIFSSRVDGGSWTDDASSRLMAGLIIDQLDDGTGTAAGGMLVHPGMSGGTRG